MAITKEKWIIMLRAAGLKVTPIRIHILELLAKDHQLLSIEGIHSSLKKGTADFVTVYRCIRKFEEVGILTSVALGDGLIRYELREDTHSKDSHHHHHLICRICKVVELIQECTIKQIPPWLKKLGYSELDHRLDFFGVCPKCQRAA
ncbi:MAG: transcriptional repressor [Xanthomonadaceae bacterium]|nr:transcriptional repressor [Xanthomonadaceae bacterium]